MANDERIREERFAQGRRRVVDYSKLFGDQTGLVASDPVVQANLLQIIRCLKEAI